MNRSKLRENIFKLLYTAEFQEKEEMPQQMSLYFTYSDDNDEDEEVTAVSYTHLTLPTIRLV